MTKTMQIPNVPDALHRQLRARAAVAGMLLSDYLLAEIQQVAELPTLEEMRARLEGRPETTLAISSADVIRAERDSR